jgi:hypothetical protein
VLIDASSAILLYNARIFDTVAGDYHLKPGKSGCCEPGRDGHPGALTLRKTPW